MGMRMHVKFICKEVIFLGLLGIIVCGVNQTLIKKYLYSGGTTITEAQYDFYEMERDSVDVLFLGSSQAGAGLNPQDLYNKYNITSYNLSSDSQPLWVSYYWLQEVLKYQSLQAVVLDCYMLWSDTKKSESDARKAFDNMRLGIVKLEAIDTVCTFDERQSRLSYLLTNLRYHERWQELSERDFSWKEDIVPPAKLKGFYLYKNQCGYQDYVPLEIRESEIDDFLPEAKSYLDKIVKLCRENDIELILIKTPTLAETLERHNAVAEYAAANSLMFFDFNEKILHEKINYDYPADMHDNETSGAKSAHANPSGARKMTHFIGDILLNNCAITPKQNWQWEETRAFNEHIWKNFQLCNETDLGKYLSMLKDESYTIFITVKDDAASSLNQSLQKALSHLGLTANWSDAFRDSYYAVIENGQVVTERISEKNWSTAVPSATEW